MSAALYTSILQVHFNWCIADPASEALPKSNLAICEVCVYHLNRCKTSRWLLTNLQGDTAFHWDCVQRSYQWNGISSLASWTYLHQFLFSWWDMANPRTTKPLFKQSILHLELPLVIYDWFSCIRTFLSIFAETMSPTVSLIFWIISPKPCRRYIWITSSKPRRRYIIFDDDLGHGNHSGELLLFVGGIVNFVVSYLICMFQDSVPAGSYNDPFLSSVCVWTLWKNP